MKKEIKLKNTIIIVYAREKTPVRWKILESGRPTLF